MDLNKGNLTTISVFIYMLASPILARYGINVDKSVFTDLFIGLGGLGVAIISARHPHDINALKNDEETVSENGDDTC